MASRSWNAVRRLFRLFVTLVMFLGLLLRLRGRLLSLAGRRRFRRGRLLRLGRGVRGGRAVLTRSRKRACEKDHA